MQQTVCCLHPEPPAPMTEIGMQERPTKPVILPRFRPRRPRRAAVSGALDYTGVNSSTTKMRGNMSRTSRVLLQHFTSPVLHAEDGPGVDLST